MNFIYILGSLGTSLLGKTHTKPLESISLSQTLEQVLKFHPSLKSKKFQTSSTKIDAEKARGLWLPKADVYVTQGLERTFSQNIRLQDKAYENQQTEEYQLAIVQRIFDGGRNNVIIRNSDEVYTDFKYQEKQTEESLALSAVRVYIGVLKDQALLKIAEEDYNRHLYLFKKIKDRTESGRDSQASLTQVKSRLLRSRSNLNDATVSLNQAKTAFTKLAGIACPEKLTPITPKNIHIPTSLEMALEDSLQHPALQSAKSKKRQAENLVDVNKAKMKPVINLELTSFNGRELSGHNGERQAYSALLTANWNIFNGLQDKKSIASARENVGAQLQNVASIELTISERINDSWLELDKVKTRITLLKEQQKLSRETADAYWDQYSISSRSLFDVLNAEIDYFSVKRNLAVTTYQEILVRGELGFFTGNLIDKIL